MAWNGGARFWLDCEGLECRKSFLVRLEGVGREEDGFAPTGMAWNGGSRFWPDWNGLRKNLPFPSSDWVRFGPVFLR
jgi:hypothetical protein